MGDDILTFEELRSVQNSERDSDTLQPLDEDFFERARNYLETKKGGGDHLQEQEYRNAKNILQDVLDMRQKKIVKLAFLSVKSNVNVENLLSHEEELFQEVEETIGAYRHDRHEEVFEDGMAADEVEEGEDEGEESGEAEDVEEEEEKTAEEVDTEEDEEPEEEPGEGGEEDDSSGSSVDDILQFDREDEEEADDAEEGEEEDEVEDIEEGESGDDRVTVRMQEKVTEFMGTDLNAYGPFEEGEEAEVPEENADVLEQQGKAERV